MFLIANKLVRKILRSCFSSTYRSDWGFCHPPAGWHETVSPALAKYVYGLFSPIAKYLGKQNYIFSINNISHSTGHVYAELDYVLRQQQTDILVQNKIIIFIWPKSPIANSFKHASTPFNFQIIVSGALHLLIYPMLLRYPQLSLDSGLSDLNHGIDKNNLSKLNFEQTQVKYKNYFSVINRTRNSYPLRSFHPSGQPQELVDFVASSLYVVLQIKDTVGNASFKRTDPNTYVYVIQKMQTLGYRVVFAGRERMPEIFEMLGVLNYANSTLATPTNDYYLVRDAYAVLSSGSGFSMIADVLGVPLLIVNVWNCLWAGSNKTLVLPSVLLVSNEELNLIDQFELTLRIGLSLPIRRTELHISCRDATAEEVVCAWQELVLNIERNEWQDSPLQKKFRYTLQHAAVSSAPARVANEFLLRNHHLL